MDWERGEGGPVPFFFSFPKRDFGGVGGNILQDSSLVMPDQTRSLSSIDSSGPLADPLRHFVGKIEGCGRKACLSSASFLTGGCANEPSFKTPVFSGGGKGVRDDGGDGGDGVSEGGKLNDWPPSDEVGRGVNPVNSGSDGSNGSGEAKMSDETVLVGFPQSDGQFDQQAKGFSLFLFLSLFLSTSLSVAQCLSF